MKLHYESADKDGVVTVKEIDFTFRLPTSQAREQYRSCSAKALETGRKFDKLGAEIQKKYSELEAELSNASLNVEVRKQVEAKFEIASKDVEKHSAKVDILTDEMYFKLLAICADSKTKSLLTDEVLTGSDLEEVREIVMTFRGKLKI